MTEPTPGYALPLTQGQLSPKDAAELQLLKEQIKRDVGFFCEGYKEQCLRRRIAVRMRARGIHSYADYGQLLLRDEEEYQKLRDVVTINVSKFYRNPEVWRVVDQQVLPALFESKRPARIWSAGCAGGEEPYTMAMALREHAMRHGREAALPRFDVLGTDIDRESLLNAERGDYNPFAFTDIPEPIRHNWFEPPAYTRVKPVIKRMVRFETRDLITGEYEGGYQVIMCRNVIIYFERAIQELLFAKFHEALAPGGILMLGKVETLFGQAASLFKPLAQRERIFVKR